MGKGRARHPFPGGGWVRRPSPPEGGGGGGEWTGGRAKPGMARWVGRQAHPDRGGGCQAHWDWTSVPYQIFDEGNPTNHSFGIGHQHNPKPSGWHAKLIPSLNGWGKPVLS